MVTENILGPIDCACVIHGDAYSWEYVDRLYNMLSRNLTRGVQLHVYTEADRIVPAPYIKHTLDDWDISGPKQSWWYKLQLFNPQHHAGPLLYFDLDIVVVNNIDWITALPLTHFWGVRDFKHLWIPTNHSINSSIMWWDTTVYNSVWQNFTQQKLYDMMLKYRGDQDYISEIIPYANRRFFDNNRVKSWRWECLDGGYNFELQCHKTPGTGTAISHQMSVLVFHGKPKPDQLCDPVVLQHWQ